MKVIVFLVLVLLICELKASKPASLVSGRQPNRIFLCNLDAPDNSLLGTIHVQKETKFVPTRILRCRNLCKHSKCKAGLSEAVPILSEFSTQLQPGEFDKLVGEIG